MRYDVTIDKKLFGVYPDIRLGLMRFKAEVEKSDDKFWSYMENEVLPKVREAIDGKEWSEIPGVGTSRAAYKALGKKSGKIQSIFGGVAAPCPQGR